MKAALFLFATVLFGCSMPTVGQIVPAARAKPAAVADAAMLFEDRGQQMEIYPTLRAAPSVKPGGAVVEHRLSKATDDAPIGPRSLGVVFNHALQVNGYLTGEIAFKPRGDRLPADLDTTQWPGLKKIVAPNVHVVVAASAREFIPLLNRLRARGDLEWVEAVVIYGNGEASAPRR